MNSQEQESVTNSKTSYSNDFHSSNSNNLEEDDDEINDPDNINNPPNSKIYLITILIHPDEEQAILSIGIRNALPIIKTINYQEITSQPAIKDCIQELEEILPKILDAAEEGRNSTSNSQRERQIQKRELPKHSQEAESNEKQLSLF